MRPAGIAERVRRIIEPTVNCLGYRVWDVRYVKEGGENYLRVVIDSPGGVGIDDCTKVSLAVDPLIDKEDIIRDPYCFEVCTPGIERELVKPEHFAEMTGKNVKIKLYRPVNGEREFNGTLTAYDGRTVTVTQNGETVSFDMKTVSKVALDDFDMEDERKNG